MSDSTPQTYANHVRRDRFGLVIGALTALAILLLLAGFLHAGAIALALLFLAFQFKARGFGLTVQDRVIRLEMQLRLERILPDDLREAARALPLRFLIALRFASDAELPGLVKRVLDGELTSGDAIKRAVTDWQADTLRV